MKGSFKGQERRRFVRLDYATPLQYKICKKDTITKLLKGYTANISEAGLLCNIKDKVKKDDILWLSFDRSTLGICENLEKNSLIYQNGVIAKVARIDHKQDGTYDIGVNFLTREEKNLSYIYPKVHFMKDAGLEPQKTDEVQEEPEGEEDKAAEPESKDFVETREDDEERERENEEA